MDNIFRYKIKQDILLNDKPIKNLVIEIKALGREGYSASTKLKDVCMENINDQQRKNNPQGEKEKKEPSEAELKKNRAKLKTAVSKEKIENTQKEKFALLKMNLQESENFQKVADCFLENFIPMAIVKEAGNCYSPDEILKQMSVSEFSDFVWEGICFFFVTQQVNLDLGSLKELSTLS